MHIHACLAALAGAALLLSGCSRDGPDQLQGAESSEAASPDADRPTDPVEFARAFTEAVSGDDAERVVTTWFDWEEIGRRAFGNDFRRMTPEEQQETASMMRDMLLFPYIDPSLREHFGSATYSDFELKRTTPVAVVAYIAETRSPIEDRSIHRLHLKPRGKGAPLAVDLDPGRGETISERLGSAYPVSKQLEGKTPLEFVRGLHEMATERLRAARESAETASPDPAIP